MSVFDSDSSNGVVPHSGLTGWLFILRSAAYSISQEA